MARGRPMRLRPVSPSATPLRSPSGSKTCTGRTVRGPSLRRASSRAARDAGGPALSLALDAVRDHPEDRRVLPVGVLAAEQADASSALVEELADLILNPRSWAAARFAERLLKSVSTGINEDNSQRRIAMLVYKLSPLPDNDPLLRRLRSQRSGSIADTPRLSRDDRSRSLLSCLIRLLESAWAWTSAGELLDALSTLPETSLRQRLRAWVLANASDADLELMIDEIEHAIASRSPTGDDLALLDRAAASCDRSVYAAKWREALGAAPGVEQVGRALASKEVPAEWRRAMWWVSLLPAEAAGAWVTACDVLASRYGRTSREALAQRTTEIAPFAKSPINAEELRSMDPLDAAARVAKWRPRAARLARRGTRDSGNPRVRHQGRHRELGVCSSPYGRGAAPPDLYQPLPVSSGVGCF